MAYLWQRWLADEFRAAGLTVIEVDGWMSRGRPASTGAFEPNGLLVDHHTGTFTSSSNPAAGINTLINGRSDLPGPLCQYGIDFLGRIWVIAAGRANVNGKARQSGTFPPGDGNRFMGVEVMTDGRQQMSAAQEYAIAKSNAVVLRHFGRGVDYLHRHQDISLSGKWDLGQWTTAHARSRTAPFMSGPINVGDDFMAALNDQQQVDLYIWVRELREVLFAGGAGTAVGQTVYRRVQDLQRQVLGAEGFDAGGRNSLAARIIDGQAVEKDVLGRLAEIKASLAERPPFPEA